MLEISVLQAESISTNGDLNEGWKTLTPPPSTVKAKETLWSNESLFISMEEYNWGRKIIF